MIGGLSLGSAYVNFLKSYLGYKTGFRPLVKPFYMLLAVTWRCNCKCPFCPTPKNVADLSLEEIERLFASNTLSSLITLSFTGGETFLRDDIVEISKLADTMLPHVKELRYASNGLLTDRVLPAVDQITATVHRPVSIKISLDGDEETHNSIRGPDAFAQANATIDGLKKLRDSGRRLNISVGFTAVNENVDQIWGLYERYGDEVEFFFKPGQDFCTRKDDGTTSLLSEEAQQTLTKFFEHFTDREFEKDWSMMQSSRRAFYRCMLDYVRDPAHRPVPCAAGFVSVSIHPHGLVFACSVHGAYLFRPEKKVESVLLGDLREADLDTIWRSEQAEKVRRMVKKGKCVCLTGCDIAPSVATGRWGRIAGRYFLGRLSRAFRK